MLLRFSFLLLLYALLSVKIDSLTPAQSCADIIRPSQKYTPDDSTLTIGTISTFSYQECGKQCRVTTLCRTAVWCLGQCTMYQEYITFGIRSPDLNCMLITLSGIAYNEVNFLKIYYCVFDIGKTSYQLVFSIRERDVCEWYFSFV